MYVLTSESECSFFCIDLDIPKADLDSVAFSDQEAKYEYLSEPLNRILKTIRDVLKIPQEGVLLEDSGGRGYHIWLFLENPIAGFDAVQFHAILKSLVDLPFEFFPKQASLGPKRKFGNLIKLPLGVHRKYGSRSTFFDLKDDCPHYIESLDENLQRLDSIRPIATDTIKRILEDYKAITPEVDNSRLGKDQGSTPRPTYLGEVSYLVGNCGALRSLTEKAERHEEFSRVEAFHLANVLLSAEDGQETLDRSLRNSYGDNYDPKLASTELEKIRPLFPTSCTALRREGICPDYCKESVRKRNEDPLQTGTTPLSVWLTRSRTMTVPDLKEVCTLISSSSNIQRAYWLLKQYHEHEDSLFFDSFDFRRFEKDLEVNSEILALALLNQERLSLSEYLPVDIPKKLNDDLTLEYRTMAYSTIYDQVVLQAVFNVVTPLFESRMQESSYGYRCDVSGERANSIFKDWREYYPRFRNAVLDEIRRNPNGFYICCDIKGYYDHIDHEILNEQIASVIPNDYLRQMLKDAIALWRAKPNKAVGLPQGPAYARVLANYYLNDFDVFAQGITTKCFRYVDDFYLFFDSREAASSGLQEIADRLRQLGLSLSEDEEKKPEIIENFDETRVTRALDKIRYGLMEETRHVFYMDEKRVTEFYDSVERHGGSIQNREDIGKMNNILASLLYTLVQDPTAALSYRKKVFSIIDLLVEKRWFYPKRLKNIFYRILELVPDNNEELLSLYKKLHPTHKVYFMLSALAFASKQQQFQSLLHEVVQFSLTIQDSYVKGFACAIAKAKAYPELSDIREPHYVDQLFSGASYFTLVKWFDAIQYRQLSQETRAIIRANISSESDEPLKMGLFSSLDQVEISYLDEQFIGRLLEGQSILTIPAQSAFLAGLTGKTGVFYALVNEISNNVKYKRIAIELVTSQAFNRYGAGHKTELENQHALYKTIEDEELRTALQSTLSRISEYLDPSADFSRTHQLVDNYNECLLYKYIGAERKYSVLELIPEKKMSPTGIDSVSDFKLAIEDFSENELLPPLSCDFDSARHEFRIGYAVSEGCTHLESLDFSVTDQNSILRALTLVAQLYKKSLYFHRRLGNAPYISRENLLVDESRKEILFKTLGMSLQLTYVSSNNVFSSNLDDIPKMLGQLLTDIFYSGNIENIKLITEQRKLGDTELFLVTFIRNMLGRDASRRYSYPRFQFLVERLFSASAHSAVNIRELFLIERLKGALGRRNGRSVSWRGICKAGDDHLTHIADAIPGTALSQAAYRYPLALRHVRLTGLHYLSRQLLIVRSNEYSLRADLRLLYGYDHFVCALVDLAIMSIEVHSLFHGLTLDSEVNFAPDLKDAKELRIGVKDCNRVFDADELANVRAALRKRREGSDEEMPIALSLKETALVLLLRAFEFVESDGVLSLKKTKGLSESRFLEVLHTCLFRIHDAEGMVCTAASSLIAALETNEDHTVRVDLPALQNHVYFVCKDMQALRRIFAIKRQTGKIDTRLWPPLIRCRRFLRRTKTATKDAIASIPFTSMFPSTHSKCSWDSNRNSIRTLMVPDARLNSLLDNLKSGKLFGYRLSYLYSGRAMLVWDLSFSIAIFLASWAFETASARLPDGGIASLYGILSDVCLWVFFPVFAKVFLWDIGHWFPKIGSFIGWLGKAKDQ